MNHANRLRISLLSVPLLLLILTSSLFAQAIPQQLEPTYEISLQVLIGSNDAVAGRADLPANLGTISKQIKSTFPFQNYRLANTFIGRLSNTGNIEYKSVSNIFGEPAEGSDVQTFLEWSMTNFLATPSGFQARSFRFGARIPVVTRQSKEAAPMLAYEPIGLTMNVIGLPVNKPTLIGTISLPKTTGTVFLIATIKPAE